MNVIEFRLCDEDRARLDDIIAGLAALVPPGTMSDAAEGLREIKTGTVPPLELHPADAPVAHLEPPADPPAAPAAPAAKVIPLAEFQKSFTTRAAESPAMKAKVRALIQKYADSVSNIPEAKRAEVLAELAVL